MQDSKAVIGALIFILVVIGINLLMYGIVRGWAQPGKKDFMGKIGQSFDAARKKEDKMDELRRKMEELEKSRKE